MSVDYTTLSLVKAIKRKGSIPTNQELFTEEDFIDIANDELEALIVPLIMSVRQGYFEKYKRYDLSQVKDGIIEIPPEAVGMKLRSVALETGPINQPAIVNLPQLSLEEVGSYYDIQGGSRRFFNGILLGPTAFYILDNKIVLYPTPNPTGIIRLYYIDRPLKLVSTTQSGQIKSINTLTNEVVLSNVPNSWDIYTTLNAVSSEPGFSTTKQEIKIISISSPTIQFDSVEGLKIGDYVSPKGTCPIPQIPVEAHPVLAQAAVVKCLESMGDHNGMKIAQAKLDENKKNMFTIITPRVDSAPKKVTQGGNGFLK